MTTYRLPIEIEHAWANWFLVDYRKESSELLHGGQCVISWQKRATDDVKRVIALKEDTHQRVMLGQFFLFSTC